jgi:large subunit ribosomal protein L3
VVQRRLDSRDGYSALQLGFEELKESKVNKPMRGHFARANVRPMRHLQEVSVDNAEEYEPGQVLDVSIFEENELVDIRGVSKGKGFQGSIKRHGFHRGPMSHGSRHHRAPGSHSASADPSWVFKGRKLPGRMGGETVTTQNLRVARVDRERNVLLVKGAVPGPKGSLVKIQSSVKERG